MSTYVPRQGSKAEAAVAALSRAPWLSASDLAVRMECDRQSVDGNISTAIREGLIRRVARDGISGFSLGRTGEPIDDSDEQAPAPPKARRKLPRKAAPIVRARQPKPAHKSNGHAVATAPAQEETSVIAVLEDGRVAVFAGERIVHMLEPQIVRRIVDLVARLSVKP